MEGDATKAQRRRVNTPGHVTVNKGSSGEFDLLFASRLTQPVKGELLKGDCYLYSTVAWRMSNQAGRDRPYAGHLGRASWTIGRVHTSALHNNG
jgi:hypothetical protein